MKTEIIIEKTKKGFSAYSVKYPVYTTARTLDALKENILEALNIYFEEQGKVIAEKDLLLNFDIPQFFEFYKVINAKALSERMGMSQSLLSQYINGIKKPSAAQSTRILKAVHQLGNELCGVRFIL